MKLRYLILTCTVFGIVLSHAQPANASSYGAVRAVGNFLSNPTISGGFLVVIVIGLLVIKYAK
ncbi:MAG: hypothetical protein HC836_49615 [Richelia sp. RM2_1_2]|nr:hypothetical protein [Richelia sp. RM2_1_2]